MISPQGIISENPVAANLAIEVLRRFEHEYIPDGLDLWDEFSDRHRYTYERHTVIDDAIALARDEFLTGRESRSLSVSDVEFVYDTVKFGLKSIIPTSFDYVDWPHGWPPELKWWRMCDHQTSRAGLLDGSRDSGAAVDCR